AVSSFTILPSPTLGSFTIATSDPVTAGEEFFFTLTAYDTYGNIKTDYEGTVSFQSWDPYPADLPTDDGTGWINGQKQFAATFYTTGAQAINSTDGAVYLNNTWTVQPGALGELRFTDVPANTVAGQAFNFNVTAYDQYGNLKTDYNGIVTFTSTDPQATLPTDDGVGWASGKKQFTATLKTVTSQWLTAEDGAVSNDTSVVLVAHHDPSYFLITPDLTDGEVGEYVVFTITVYDQYGNPANVSANLNVLLDDSSSTTGDFYDMSEALLPSAFGLRRLTVNAGTNQQQFKYMNTMPGSYLLSGEDSTFALLGDTATINVNPADISHLFMVSGNNQTGTVDTDLAQTFVVRVEDSANNPLQWVNVTWSIFTYPAGASQYALKAGAMQGATVFSVTNADGEATAILHLGTMTGTYMVGATVSGLEVFFFANATADVPAHIVISPSTPVEVSADDAETTITATVYDQYWNLVEDGTIISWTINPDGGNTGVGESIPATTTTTNGIATATFTTSTTAGDSYTITASNGPATNTTAVITVIPGTLASISIDQAGWAGTADQTTDFTATGHDAHGNVVPAWTVKWETDDPWGSIDGTGHYTPGMAGTWTIWANNTGDTISDSITVTITPGARAGILIEPQGTVNMLNSSTQEFNAYEHDAKGNLIGPANVDWAIEGGIGTLSQDTGVPTTLFTATNIGYGNITITDGTYNDRVMIYVTDQVIAYILIEDLAGNPIGALTLTADQNITLYARAYNETHVSLGLVEVDWSVTGGIGDLVPVTGSQVTFFADKVGTGKVWAVHSSGKSASTGTITVTPGAVASITISPSFKTTDAITPVDFDAVARDANGNINTSATITWEAENGAIDANGVFTPELAGTWTIWANHSGVSGE
ncbi:MAG: hypothetical protein QCI38_06490, partial [Candidatus Thermoplasmatota archaeon]|nr:hypothetical protein [Candidatus Thermoplasmatota archaeon]